LADSDISIVVIHTLVLHPSRTAAAEGI
jgi:hypothetical protein